jgi:RimJ/RimL family protein N-acetyltransferase
VAHHGDLRACDRRGRADAQLVEAGTDRANHAMSAVFRRVGWREDGTVTEIGRDWLMYRITRREWQPARG